MNTESVGYSQKPFVGLRPFETSERILFYGRDKQIFAILNKLHETHFVALVGRSGCGKSSLINAGIIPKLLAGFMVSQRDNWVYAYMKPGYSPLYNLAHSLLKVTNNKQEVITPKEIYAFVNKIKNDYIEAVTNILSPIFERKDTNFLFFLDQFEEIFRFSIKSRDIHIQEEASIFVSLVLNLNREGNLPLYTLLAMRSDFISDCDYFYGLPEALNKCQYLIPRLTNEQLRKAITNPVYLFNAEISSALVNKIVNEEIQKEDSLPVIQHALMRTWDIWTINKTGIIGILHYEKAGTIHNALSDHADSAMDGMAKKEEKLTKRIFQCLVDIDYEGRGIRRPCRLNEICKITGAKKTNILGILNKFRTEGRSFILITDDPNGKDKVIDISHESFIRQWKKMREWIVEEAEDKKQFLKLYEAKKDYGKGTGEYLKGIQLGVNLAWWEKKKPTGIWVERYLITKEEKRNAKEIVQKIYDFIRKSKEKAEKDKRRGMIRNIIISSISVLFIIALISAIISFSSAEKAGIERQKAETARQEAEIAQQNTEAARLEAIEAREDEKAAKEKVEIAHKQTKIAWEEAEKEKENSLDALVFNYWNNGVSALKANDFLRACHYYARAATLCFDYDLIRNYLFSIQTVISFQSLQVLFYNRSSVKGVCFSHDAKLILTWNVDNSARLCNTANGSLAIPPLRHDGDINGAVFTKDDKHILTWSADKTAKLWYTRDGSPASLPMQHGKNVNGALFSRNEKLILTWSDDKSVKLWHTKDGSPAAPPLTHAVAVKEALFSKDEKYILTKDEDGNERLWDMRVDYDFPKEHLPLLVEVRTGTRMDDYGNIFVLSPEEWLKKQKEYKKIAEKHLVSCKYNDANLYALDMTNEENQTQ